jgi:hypothetical protein
MIIRSIPPLIAAAGLMLGAGTASAAVDVNNMVGECRVRAAAIFGVEVDSVPVKYEGQRTDKTHAVNGSVFVRGQNETFQCNFQRDGYTWKTFIVNFPQR